ncbi:MAG: Sec-independent protein translocase protein TatB [Thermodesulfobacteriota bacterium]
MFDIGMQELLVILVIALIVFGPNKIPELAKSFGKALREFKKATEEMKNSFEEEAEEFKNSKENLPKLIEEMDSHKEPETPKSPSSDESPPNKPLAS